MSFLDTAGKIISESGLMGAVFVFVTAPLAIFAYRINNKSHELEKEHADEIAELAQSYSQQIQTLAEKRTEDVKEFSDKLIDINDKWNESVGEVIRSAESQKEWLKDIKEIVKDLGKRNAR
jgi:methyl-accepting chemotaxis protein